MTPRQLRELDDALLRDGPQLLEWCRDHGQKAPTLLDLERERVRRGFRRALARPRRPVRAYGSDATQGNR
jgi:hypothetical protein